MSASLKTGIRALTPASMRRWCFWATCPGLAELIKRLVAAYNPLEDERSCCPCHQASAAIRFCSIGDSSRDAGTCRRRGARHLIGLHEDVVFDLDVENAVFADVDTSLPTNCWQGLIDDHGPLSRRTWLNARSAQTGPPAADQRQRHRGQPALRRPGDPGHHTRRRPGFGGGDYDVKGCLLCEAAAATIAEFARGKGCLQN